MRKYWIPERFRKCRENAGLDQADIASVCLKNDGTPISRSAVTQWESKNGTMPALNYLGSAVELLREHGVFCSADYMMGLEKNYRSDIIELSEKIAQLPGKSRLLLERQIDSLINHPLYAIDLDEVAAVAEDPAGDYNDTKNT